MKLYEKGKIFLDLIFTIYLSVLHIILFCTKPTSITLIILNDFLWLIMPLSHRSVQPRSKCREKIGNSTSIKLIFSSEANSHVANLGPILQRSSAVWK